MSLLSRRACITGATLALIVCVTRHYTSPIASASDFLTLFAAYSIGFEYIAVPVLRCLSGILGNGAAFSASMFHGAFTGLMWIILMPFLIIRAICLRLAGTQHRNA